MASKPCWLCCWIWCEIVDHEQFPGESEGRLDKCLRIWHICIDYLDG